MIVFALILKSDENPDSAVDSLRDSHMPLYKAFRASLPDDLLRQMHSLPQNPDDALKAIRSISRNYPLDLKKLVRTILDAAAMMAEVTQTSA
jgi:hypothetical protein